MNFALILFVLVVISGALWLADHFFFRKLRQPGSADPWWVEYGASLFPVILIVFLLRSFLVEPFKIPSGSMMPTLLSGDFILVNKYTYGIRIPILNKKVIEINSPQRGDVVVFRYPPDPTQDYIKRVVGLPGDRVEYRNKHLFINGTEQSQVRLDDYLDKTRLSYTQHYRETLGEVSHEILINEDVPPYILQPSRQFSHRGNCHYNSEGFTCTVPAGHYFMMGDNRDNSLDSRVWGFVPDENLTGKAYFVWMHAESLLPPKDIDFSRIGSFK